MQTTQKPQAFARCGKWVGVALTPMLFLSGCATNTQTGTLAGGVGGAAIGGVLGSLAHVPVAGALVGGLVGASVGNAVGHDADVDARNKAIAADVAARGGPVSLEQIRDMVHNNVADGVIMEQIRTTRTMYRLTPEQITWLHGEGVSDALIQYMQQAGTYGPPRVVEPYPAPVGVGVVVGGGYGYGHRY